MCYSLKFVKYVRNPPKADERGMGENFPHAFGVTATSQIVDLAWERHRGGAPVESEHLI